MNLSKAARVFLSKTGTQVLAMALFSRYSKIKRRVNKRDGSDLVNWKSKSTVQSIFVDITSLMVMDHGGGIQRVQRSLIENWVANPPEGLNIFPIFYSEPEMKFLYLNQNQMPILKPINQDRNGIAEIAEGDVFLNLDLNYRFAIENEVFYKSLRKHKVYIYTVLYDLLPLSVPNAFPAGIKDFHRKWLEVASRYSKLLCISKTVEADVIEWASNNGMLVQATSITLGSNFSDPLTSTQLNQKNDTSSAQMNFLIVSTLEVRKSHEQVLNAFEILWEEGHDVTLTFVGRKGWKVDDLLARIESHRYLNKKLFWLNNLSDEGLEKTYRQSTALINASIGEGFGLPLVEASFFGLPLILRDIPIFREVAGENAWYFATHDSQELATSVKSWLEEYAQGKIHPSTEINAISWQDTCNQIIDIVKLDKFDGGRV